MRTPSSIVPTALIALLALPQSAWAADPAAAAAGTQITSHRASISLEPASRVYACTDTFTLFYPEGSSDSPFVRLHPAWKPLSFRVDGREARYVFRDGMLSWERPSDDSTAEVILEFRGRIDFPSEYTRVDEEHAVLRAEEVLPWGPGVLRSGRLAVTLPEGWSVVAPGRRAGPGDGTTQTFSWDEPIGAIGWICAGRYLPPERGGSGDRISLYRLPGDTSAGPGRSRAMLLLCDSLLDFYGSAFSPYRFGEMAVVEVEDWVAGGSVLAVAAPSFIMVKRHAFETDDPFNRVETILPHEVAHQWWAMTVFPAERASAFLSEGLCEYSAILYGEFSGRAGHRDTLSRSPLLRPLIARVRRGTSVALDTAVDIRAVLTQYLKAAYVHHMLRGTIGDTAYRTLLREFASRYAGRTAAISDFRRLAGEVSGEDLEWFFGQWVTGKGLPSIRVYNARSAKVSGGWKVTGRIRVVGYERYTADVVVELRTAVESARTKIRVGLDEGGSYRNDAPFAFVSAAEPVSIAADPDGDLLLARRLPEKLSDLRDPGDALMIVGTGGEAPFLRSIARDDSARFSSMGWGVRVMDDTAVTLGHLQQDRIILYGGREENAVAARMPRPLPLAAAGGSADIAGETVRDSTLALVQAVENPWLADGLLVCVQPFSPAARPELRPFDHSWVLVRGHDPIHSGTWEAADPDLEVRVRPAP